MDNCGRCNKPMRPLQTTCDCGWKKPKTEKKMEQNRYQCQCTAGGLRCPALGTMRRGVREGAMWLCRDHYRVHGNLENSYRITQEKIEKGASKTKHWKDEMVEGRMDRTKQELRNVAAAVDKIARRQRMS